MKTFLKTLLKKGVALKFGRYRIMFKVARENPTSRNEMFDAMMLKQTQYLQNKYPELKDFDLTLTIENAHDIFDFYCGYIPVLLSESREAWLRVLLGTLRKHTNDDLLRKEATKEIAKSDLRNAIPHRAQMLISDNSLSEELGNQTQELERKYGAAIISEVWSDSGRDESLIYYFKNNIDDVKGKNILHISPETGLAAWFKKHAAELNINYATSNVCGDDVDYHQDITNFNFDDNTYDLVICHRVLEHVLDDVSAFNELYRIIKPGGELQISVPESPHVDTSDWVIPDTTHHNHVRHYGRDFTARLEAAGFSVALDDWFLSKSRSELLTNQSLPLRMYSARK